MPQETEIESTLPRAMQLQIWGKMLAHKTSWQNIKGLIQLNHNTQPCQEQQQQQRPFNGL